MSTYLLAWAVGEFDCVRAKTKNGVHIAIYSPPGRASQGHFALNCGVKALDFYDDFFDVPYPLPKLDMLCVTEFAMGRRLDVHLMCTILFSIFFSVLLF